MSYEFAAARSRRPTVIYVLDEFREVDVDPDEALKLMKADPLKLFDSVRKVVEEELGRIRGVEVGARYLGKDEGVVEFLLETDIGHPAIKVIVSEDPAKALRKFYEAEKTSSMR